MAEGMLSLEELKKEVAAGTIDTVVAAFVDMQGRLIGKRFHGKFFADGGYEETHACNYLLGVDIEMEPVPGYKATSWQNHAPHAVAARYGTGVVRCARPSHA